MVQAIEGFVCPVTIDYTYDPVTGQVQAVDYQRYNAGERFIHKYEYSVAGQLLKVTTSRDNSTYLTQAEYFYNESGSLIRTVLAEDLQGIDYVYNLSGQLKAINHPSLEPSNDPGGDGPNGIAADLFGLSLEYYNGDYSRGNTPTPIVQNNTVGQDQFNGNIKALGFNTDHRDTGGNFAAYSYGYNKNNWLASASFGSASHYYLRHS